MDLDDDEFLCLFYNGNNSYFTQKGNISLSPILVHINTLYLAKIIYVKEFVDINTTYVTIDTSNLWVFIA